MASIAIPKVKLSNDEQIPIIGLGTWKSDPNSESIKSAVKTAIDIGYRHFDCAFHYGNEADIGEAFKERIEEGIISRSDLFITSKVGNTYHSRHLVPECLKTTLTDLKTNYVDLYLVHWPFGYKEGGDTFPKDENGKVLTTDTDYLETWKGMEDCHRLGLCRSIGLSNFNSYQVQRVLNNCEIKPVLLQVECHPYLTQEKLFKFCQKRNLAMTAYSCLGSPARPWAKSEDPVLLEDPVVMALTTKYNRSPAQICLRYLIQRGIIVIPKSANRGRLESNFDVFDFELTKDDMKQLGALNRNFRVVYPKFVKDHQYFPFKAPF